MQSISINLKQKTIHYLKTSFYIEASTSKQFRRNINVLKQLAQNKSNVLCPKFIHASEIYSISIDKKRNFHFVINDNKDSGRVSGRMIIKIRLLERILNKISYIFLYNNFKI